MKHYTGHSSGNACMLNVEWYQRDDKKNITTIKKKFMIFLSEVRQLKHQ